MIFLSSDVNLCDSFGKTPLHNAINGKHLNIVILLLKSGADVKSKDERGDTPLHEAVRTGDEQIVQVRKNTCFFKFNSIMRKECEGHLIICYSTLLKNYKTTVINLEF